MFDTIKTIELQSKIVRCFAEAVFEKWDYLLVNFEREDTAGEPVEDCLAVVFTKDGASWKRSSIQAPLACLDSLVELANAMAKDQKGSWASCTLELEANGKYRFSFSYGPPRRLNGDFSDDALFKHFVPRPL